MIYPPARRLGPLPLLAVAALWLGPVTALAQPATPQGPMADPPIGPTNPEPNPASPTGPVPPLPPANPDMPDMPDMPDRPVPPADPQSPDGPAPRTPDDGSGTVAPTRDTPGATPGEAAPPQPPLNANPPLNAAPPPNDSASGAPTAGSDFATADQDSDGSVSLMEFATHQSGQGKAIAQARTPKKANNAATEALNRASAQFLARDSNKDGRLSAEEMASPPAAP